MEEEILTVTQEPEAETESAVEVVDVQFRPGQKIYYFDPAGGIFHSGDHLIIETARGPEYGICTGGNHRIRQRDVVAPLRSVIRSATAADERTVQENRGKEKRAYEICLQKIAEHGLDMQLVSAEYAFDGSKILFFFTADERVDFRELVKNLAATFHTRIELRQIGVRDKAKMLGGLGICGRPFCCSSFLDDFQPVSIKMAKTQNLSLNPVNISGTCGRLMCCLKYEQSAYEDLLRTSPKVDSFVDTPDGRGTVTEVDLLRQQVKVRMEDQPDTVTTFSNEDIAILRNGKAKKNDPPIPPDLAPISGNGKRERREQEDSPIVLETIRFRYSTEQVSEEPAPKAEADSPPAAGSSNDLPRSKPRRRGQKPRPAGEVPALTGEKTAVPTQGKASASAPNKLSPDRQEKAQSKLEKKQPPRGDSPESQAKSAAPRRRPGNYRRNRKPRASGGNAES